ncbi:MAG: methionyl-tRNA formyltransferase [Ilumatobacteraceae bacterium]
MIALAPLPSGAATRIVYFGTPEVAVAPLRALHKAGIEIDLVITRPDTRRGRGSEVTPSPVKQAALEMNLRVALDIEDISGVNRDSLLGVVVAYGKLIPASTLAQVPMINLHFSMLPRWRGAAPVERAILAGDRTTGVCVMRVVEGLDTGEVYRRSDVEIRDTDTAVGLRDRLVHIAIPLLLDVVRNGAGIGAPQVGEPTYAAKINAKDLEFDWTLSAEQLVRITRIGVGHTTFRGKRLNIHSASAMDKPVSNAPGRIVEATAEGIVVATGHGAICLQNVQPEGKPVLDALSWSRGARLEPNERFG